MGHTQTGWCSVPHSGPLVTLVTLVEKFKLIPLPPLLSPVGVGDFTINTKRYGC